MNEQLSRMPVRIDAGGVCIQGHDWGGMNVAHIRFRSCPDEWCTSWCSSRASPPGWAGHAAGKAGRLTMGSSLIGAIVSSVM